MTKTIIFKKFAGEVDLMRSLLTIQVSIKWLQFNNPLHL